jgi:Spy/CpxP family protein refolding chaperone
VTKGTWAVISASVLLSGSILIAADDAGPGAAPATQPAMHHGGKNKLPKPWSEMTDLTDDQKEKIEKIHADELAQERDLKAKEQADIEALLTDDQKAELKTLESKAKKPKKEKGPATEPAT